MSSPTSPQAVLHIAGWSSCGFYKRAANVLSSLSLLFPSRLKVVNHEYGSRSEYRAWLIDGSGGFRSKVEDPRAHSHTSSPFVWFGSNSSGDARTVKSFLGGCDDTLDWCRTFCEPKSVVAAGVTHNDQGSILRLDGHDGEHSYDYDLVVIGGGSGGLAASKEAASLGARVAVLDFVKPSPAGTSWGLGGTCVNVGCIPKKLMHQAALLNESLQTDSKPFGIASDTSSSKAHSWSDLRESVQNHIRSLNFKYRVALREKNVTYLNKLAKFVDPHTLEVTDKKGRTTTLTSSRFLVAVGGRPAPLANCEGGHLAITSDDLFAKEQDPGKVLCVGASYISLECAGFLAGLGHDVTVAVRSILLRGFDRECADKIGKYMEGHSGVKFKYQLTPAKMERLSQNNKIRVTFSDGSTDDYDTVMAAVGREADTDNLGLESVKIDTNPKNKKIICTNEQSTCPNIYAIGDVMEGCPELTPVAVQAGLSLARRLFGKSNEPMDYINICTTVFTPIEYATVGYSEEDAQAFVGGAKHLEVYHKEFAPLEWTLTEQRSQHGAFAKILVDKRCGSKRKIVGMHYVGPNAGEIMQGYGAAMKTSGVGLTMSDLENTVGIHPTSAEELVTMAITKNSGENAKAGGC